MAEVWELIDIHRNPTGESWVRGSKTPIPSGRYHIIVSIWTVTPDGKILITKRHKNKSFGEMWENTGGAAKVGETSIEAALRELEEETGLKPNADDFIFLGDVWHQGYVVDTYLYKTKLALEDLKLQAEEVVDAKLVSMEEIDAIHKASNIVPSVYRTFCCYRREIKAELS